MGITRSGIDLYVPQSKLSDAKDIIKNNQDISLAGPSETNDETYPENNYDRKRKIIIWTLLIVFFSPALIGILLFLWTYFCN
jgi:hypothetical protein